MALVAAAGAGQAAPISGPPERLVLDHVTVIDVRHGRRLQDRAVVIEGERIASVQPSSPRVRAGGARVLDMRGRFVIPGLADMHHHLESGAFVPGAGGSRPEAAAASRDAVLADLLNWGVTAVFCTGNCSGSLPAFQSARRRAAEGPDLLPAYHGVGTAISTEGGHASDARFNSRIPKSPDEARAMVRDLADAGVDAIKVIYSDQGHIARAPLRVMGAETLDAIVAEAHGRKLKVLVHAPTLRHAKAALRAGADGLVHSIADAPVDAEFIALMKRNRATYTTTLSLYTAFADVNAWAERLRSLDRRSLLPPTVYSGFLSAEGSAAYHRALSRMSSQNLAHAYANARSLVRAGAPVLAGTDTAVPGVLSGVSSQAELVLLVEAGLTPLEALRAATLTPAQVLGRPAGVVERGAAADLVVLRADPLADIRNIAEVEAVLRRGQIVTRASSRNQGAQP